MALQREFQTDAADARSILSESSAATFMASVYRWMVVGLAVTGVTAFAVATSPAIQAVVLPMRTIIYFATIALGFGFGFVAPRARTATAALMFLAYAGLLGLVLSVIFLVYSLGSIYVAFGVTAAMFGALSVYGTVTKRDLSAWATFLFLGMIGVFIASMFTFFIHVPGFNFVLNCAVIVVFAGYTAYNTQKLRQFHASSGYASAGALAVTGALMLYVDFINMFMAILQLTGNRRR